MSMNARPNSKMDDLSYLEPGFDPAKLRVPDLRRVLLMHDVPFPSSAKKAELVELFKEHISPNSANLLAAKEDSGRAVPDILDASITSSLPASEPPRSARKSTARKSTTIRSQTPRGSRRKTTAATETPKLEVKSENEKPKVTDEYDKIKVEEGGSPFSSENPFQTPRTRTSPKTSRKKSSLTSVKKEGATPPKYIATPAPQRASPRAPIALKVQSSPNGESEYGTPVKFSSELFLPNEPQYPEGGPAIIESEGYEVETPEEMEIHAGELAGYRAASPFAFPVKSFVTWVIVLLGVSYLMWWRNEKFKVGYCEVEGLGRYVPDFPEHSWRQMIEPDCTPCPSHAVCYSNFHAKCVPDYVYEPSVWSLGGMLPFAPKCVPDTEKLQRAKVLLEETLQLLRKRYADVQCGSGGTGKNDPTVAVADLRAKLYSMKSPSLSDDAFAELWELAFKDLVEQEEVYRVDVDAGERLGSTSPSEFPFTCMVKTELGAVLSANKGKLVGTLVLALSTLVLYRSSSKYRERQAKVRDLVRRSMTFLSEQQKRSDSDQSGSTARYVIMSQLKDNLLVDTYDAAERRQVWDNVQKQVEANTNVRSRQMEVHGEIMRIWEWIGI
ncbi:Man1-Src1p-C-terminal domain-containing protein [Lipomyces orientalis]|uniref:Man1-Src1p-C-terminal domain-containing protein n=1 Tax=Lipomyces orientalis TaxID=1233043 RepID=A0ACC3TL02_9ASCO